MPGSRVYMMGFDEGRTLQKEQARDIALGTIGQDRVGNLWSYVEFQQNVSAGQWVQDRVNVTQAVNATTAGKNELKFTSALPANYDHVGVYGLVTGGTNGQGQGFIIEALDTDRQTARIQLLHDTSDRFFDRQGWKAAVSGGTPAVTLYYPGGVTAGTTTPSINVRGVVQVDVDEFTSGNNNGGVFGWVQQTGIGVCLLESTGTDVGTNGMLFLDGSGYFQGGTIGSTAIPSARVLARYNPGQDGLVLADLNIVNTASRPFGPRSLPVGAGPGEVS